MECYTEIGFPRNDAEMLSDAENAVTEAGLWPWLKTSDINNVWEPEFQKIEERMKYKGHSGASFVWTMFNMKSMATLGWEAWARQKVHTFR